jgi:tight adherence protein B
MQLSPMIFLAGGAIATLVMLVFAFSGPSLEKAQSRRLNGLKERHTIGAVSMESQMRRMIANRKTFGSDGFKNRFIPDPELIAKRLEMTGKPWTLGKYLLVSLGLGVFVALALWFKGASIILALLMGVVIGAVLPHKIVGMFIKKRIANFTARFPDAIELMVRGLRSGLPISETLQVVASELPGPIGVEFRLVIDKIKIGRTMDEALIECAQRLNTPEFQFFVITLAIQRETGGNLAETLSNLADVLRKRAQMKLKIKAMASESKASAYIVGSLPFIVFILVYMVNPKYLAGFFTDERLMIAGGGGLVWMGIGVFIMAQMINFEI